MTRHAYDLLVFDWEGTLADPWRLPLRSILFPGVYEMLSALDKAGYLLAVATGKSRSGLNHAMTECGVKQFFADTQCADESAAKPDPEMLLALSMSLQMKPERMLMIGDTTFDLDMAARAGIDAVAVGYGLHTAQLLQGRKPLYYASGVTELHKWLLP